MRGMITPAFLRMRSSTEKPKLLIMALTSHQALTRHQNQRTRLEEPGPGPHLEDDVEAVLGRVQDEDEAARRQEQQDRGQPADHDIVLLGAVLLQEAAIKIMHHVGGAPVRWVRLVEELAAIRPPTIRPMNPPAGN